MNFIDAHSHLQNSETAVDRVILAAAERNCMLHMVNATSPEDWNRVLQLGKSPEIVPFLGLHPWYIEEDSSHTAQALLILEDLVAGNSCGLGELGLDKKPGMPELRLQSDILSKQLELAHNYGRPVSFHCFKAFNELLLLLRNLKAPQPFMVHAFTASEQIAGNLLELGGFLSLPLHILSRGESVLRRLLAYIPVERLLLESDFPQTGTILAAALAEYGITAGGAGVSSEPESMHLLYEAVAKIKGIDLKSLVNIIEANFREFTKGIYE